jgi:hypothetical protein
MSTKGHYATYGDVRLHRDPHGVWHGSIDVEGLSVVARCMPSGPVSGGPASAGTQAFFPPLSAGVAKVVRLALAGHREQQCEGGASWTFDGTHPLVGGAVLGSTTFQFGYDLTGGAYPR